MFCEHKSHDNDLEEKSSMGNCGKENEIKWNVQSVKLAIWESWSFKGIQDEVDQLVDLRRVSFYQRLWVKLSKSFEPL